MPPVNATQTPTNPFPSPSPTIVPAAGNGYVVGGYMGGSASGGQVPPTPGSTSTPFAFGSTPSGGFFVDLLGRFGTDYLASLTYENLLMHGADNALISYGQARLLFQPAASHAAFGLGFATIQRSTSNANMNTFGIGANLLPDFGHGVSPYASAYVYPHVQTQGVGATFTAVDAGVVFAPKGKGGLFLRVGGALRSGLPATISPNSITALQAGLGTSF